MKDKKSWLYLAQVYLNLLMHRLPRHYLPYRGLHLSDRNLHKFLEDVFLCVYNWISVSSVLPKGPWFNG